MGNHLYSNNRSVKMVFRIFILFCLLTIGAMANQGDSYLDNDESELLVPFGEPQLIASSRSICCFTQKMCVPVTTTSLTESLSDKPKTEDKDKKKKKDHMDQKDQMDQVDQKDQIDLKDQKVKEQTEKCHDKRSCNLCLPKWQDTVVKPVRIMADLVKETVTNPVVAGVLGVAPGSILAASLG